LVLKNAPVVVLDGQDPSNPSGVPDATSTAPDGAEDKLRQTFALEALGLAVFFPNP
jgi:hypothetical protein